MSARAYAISVAAALVVSPSLASAAVPAPCKGCVLVAPGEGARDVPMLVALHGDIDHADTTAAPWKPAIVARGWALLSIECPVAEGCDKGSFWRWNGPVSWLVAQVDKAIAAHPAIDRGRVFVSGWSGGASYLGFHAQEIARSFAAIVIHGGGVKPPARGCAERSPPVYFLVGSANPLHALTKDLRAYFEGCRHEVVWDLLPGKGHPEELAALDRARADAILDRLDGWTRAPAPSATVFADAEAPPTTRAPGTASAAPNPPSPSTPPAPPKGSRGCATAHREGALDAPFVFAVVWAALSVARRRRQ